MLRWIGLTFILLTLGSGQAWAATDDMPDGKKLFDVNCATCHGLDGRVTAFGRQLKPYPARNLRALSEVVSRDELRRIITYGVQGTAMDPKKYVLNDLQIDAVIDYIKSFTYTPDLERGKERYRQVCATCHGADGRAKTGLGAMNLVYTKLDLAGIVHTMRYGRPGTMMTSKRHQLTNPDINDIAHYVYELRYDASPVRGSKLYEQLCVRCHATPADIRLTGNIASRPRSLDSVSDQLLYLRIKHGRHLDKAGNAVAKLSDDQIQDIISYIRQETR
jgi:cytochrome c oxidase cbb3-type subunit III